MTKGASDLLAATSDESVTVNVNASDNDFISDNSAPLLGAFMGNEITGGFTAPPVSSEIDGNGIVNEVSTNQEINPVALGKMDEINGKPGQTTLHEVTESYKAGKLSQASGKSVGKATSSDANNPNSVYRMSHDSVIPQSGSINEIFYNSAGQRVYRNQSNFSPAKLQYTTSPNNTVFHTVPKGS